MITKVDMEEAKNLFERCSPVFLALGDRQRQKLFLDIAEAGEVNVSELASMSSLSRPAVSHHLKLLKDYGIVDAIKKGTQIFYKIDIFPALESVISLISAIQKIAKKEKIQPV